MNHVPTDPLTLAPGVAELLADPAHYRRTEMHMVDYGNAPAEDLLPSLAPQVEPELPGRWTRLWSSLRGKA